MDELGIGAGDHRRPFLRRGRGDRLRAGLSREDARAGAACLGDASLAGRRDLLVLFADGSPGRRPPLCGDASPVPAGTLRLPQATACVFSPNKVPDGYADLASIALVLRPAAFRANAIDVAGLYRHTLETAPRYQRDRGADRGHLGRQGHGRRRGNPQHRARPRHRGRRAGLGAQSRPQAGLDRAGAGGRRQSRTRPAATTICRRWRGRSSSGSPRDAYGEGICTKARARPLGEELVAAVEAAARRRWRRFPSRHRRCAACWWCRASSAARRR